MQTGSRNHQWTGGQSLANGYVIVKAREHPRASNGYVYEHVLAAERALGRYLPVRAQVHHVDGNTQNNAPSNLVVCDNQQYHSLLHMRARALRECGDANALKCWVCRKYDRQEDISVPVRGASAAFHRSCKRQRNRERYLVSIGRAWITDAGVFEPIPHNAGD
jgi:hypothetical protein